MKENVQCEEKIEKKRVSNHSKYCDFYNIFLIFRLPEQLMSQLPQYENQNLDLQKKFYSLQASLSHINNDNIKI